MREGNFDEKPYVATFPAFHGKSSPMIIGYAVAPNAVVVMVVLRYQLAPHVVNKKIEKC